jgi:hypothetical protein
MPGIALRANVMTEKRDMRSEAVLLNESRIPFGNSPLELNINFVNI